MVDLYLSTSYDNYRPVSIIENFESLVWTERFNSPGEFELYFKVETFLNMSLTTSQLLLSSESSAVMMIETIDIQRYSDHFGGPIVKVSGQSLEAFLAQRTHEAYNVDNQVFSGLSIPEVANFLVNRYCIDPATAGAANVIPGLSVGTPPAASPVTVDLKRSNILASVQGVLDLGGYGFSIRRYPTQGLVFRVEPAVDISVPGSPSYREYSEDMENFGDLNTLLSVAKLKNHARVHGARTAYDVYAPGTPSSVSGLDRRTIVVNASEVGRDATGPVSDDYPALQQRGLIELLQVNNRFQSAIDGEVTPETYGDMTASKLGNIVAVKDGRNRRGAMQITEIVTSIESGVYKRTPTFVSL